MLFVLYSLNREITIYDGVRKRFKDCRVKYGIFDGSVEIGSVDRRRGSVALPCYASPVLLDLPLCCALALPMC